MLAYLPVRVISCRDVQLQHTKTSVLISLHFRNWIWGPTQMEGCRRASERDVIEWHSCNGWASLIVLAKKNCVHFCVDSTRSQMKMFTLSLESITLWKPSHSVRYSPPLTWSVITGWLNSLIKLRRKQLSSLLRVSVNCHLAFAMPSYFSAAYGCCLEWTSMAELPGIHRWYHSYRLDLQEPLS